jgi:hypothetical protein
MCDERKIDDDSMRPDKRLSALIAKEMGVVIDPNLLRLFILAHWGKIAALGHKIHDRACIPDAGTPTDPLATEDKVVRVQSDFRPSTVSWRDA